MFVAHIWTISTSNQAIKQKIEANQLVKLVGVPKREYQSIYVDNHPILSKKSIIKQPEFINPNHPILSRKSIIETWILRSKRKTQIITKYISFCISRFI